MRIVIFVLKFLQELEFAKKYIVPFYNKLTGKNYSLHDHVISVVNYYPINMGEGLYEIEKPYKPDTMYIVWYEDGSDMKYITDSKGERITIL